MLSLFSILSAVTFISWSPANAMEEGDERPVAVALKPMTIKLFFPSLEPETSEPYPNTPTTTIGQVLDFSEKNPRATARYFYPIRTDSLYSVHANKSTRKVFGLGLADTDPFRDTISVRNSKIVSDTEDNFSLEFTVDPTEKPEPGAQVCFQVRFYHKNEDEQKSGQVNSCYSLKEALERYKSSFLNYSLSLTYNKTDDSFALRAWTVVKSSEKEETLSSGEKLLLLKPSTLLYSSSFPYDRPFSF